MATLSTHVLDTAAGRPAAGVPVTLLAPDGTVLGEGVTDADGRVASVGPDLAPGTYRLRFVTAAHLGEHAFYPEVDVVFRIAADEHHHVPLLLSPHGYTTYRGS
ncbi:hydroxyisourate hydrolase [Nocardioides coralli]|uniref:hydroxyisourate hydrolase n=1 Tax=Nocardioides coralli TaxID=2872154 RepID=UPI001CA43C84|nr:hydroxyisourate hydrolase [Nocardioides coralli]QZY29855.1 hydroxyisourate hydrolase [Nocardioides coralli]